MRTPSETRRQRWAIVAVAVAVLVLSLLLQSAYFELVLTQVLLWAVLSLGWNILCGYGGYASFGHAVFWGLGAYTVALAMIDLNLTPWVSIPFCAVVGAAAGAVIGFPTFRLRGHYFGLAMLAYPLAILYVFQWLGYQELTLPMKRGGSAILYMQFSDPRFYVVLALGLLVAALAISLWVENSRFGMALTAIKQNEPAAEAAGIDTWKWKMLALMLSGAISAVAGGLYAVVLLVLTPDTVFGILASAQALILALFGGVGSLWGPVIGAFVLVPLAEGLNAQLGSVLPGIQGVVYGVAIIAIILCAPEGVYWRVLDRINRNKPPAPREAMPPAPAPLIAAAEPRPAAAGGDLLLLKGIGIAFGGLRALDQIDLAVPEGGLYGIIGPNGAGKTTLFNVVNGFLAPGGGTIEFAGEPITGLRPNRVCRRGIGRTFQVVRAFARMSVLENVIVGAYVHAPDDTAARNMALLALDRVGLSARADAIAGGLTTRELRLMELARALASRPRLMLLDETLAGLGHEDLDGILGVIRQLRADGITVLIIEHTMQAMVNLVDHFTVLDHGRLIAEGEPGKVVRDQRVIEAYLGKKWLERMTATAN